MVADASDLLIQGNASTALACRDRHVLYDGPRGSGKTRPIAEKIVMYARTYQGTRILVMRRTRASMTETTLVTLEFVLRRLWPQALTGCMRSHVSSYIIGRSEIVIQGWEDEARARSGEYAIIWCDEGHELTLDVFESVGASLRWPIRDYYQFIVTSNPDSDKHFLWVQSDQGIPDLVGKRRIHRIQSRHKDNPACDAEYLAALSSLTGIRRRRFYLGEWCAAEGQVLDNWSDTENVLSPPMRGGEVDYENLGIKWYGASFDWGHSAAGVLQVWGMTESDRCYQVAEIYTTKWQPSEWCAQLVTLNKKFPLEAIVCDPSKPEMIVEFNTCLGYVGDGPDAVAFKASNKRRGDLGGIMRLYEMIGSRQMVILRDNMPRGIDQALRDAGRACSFIEEVPGYVWAQTPDGRYMKDDSDAKCDDHAMDAARYWAMYVRHADHRKAKRVQADVPGTMGAMIGWNKMQAAWEMAREEGITYAEAREALAE